MHESTSIPQSGWIGLDWVGCLVRDDINKMAQETALCGGARSVGFIFDSVVALHFIRFIFDVFFLVVVVVQLLLIFLTLTLTLVTMLILRSSVKVRYQMPPK